MNNKKIFTIKSAIFKCPADWKPHFLLPNWRRKSKNYAMKTNGFVWENMSIQFQPKTKKQVKYFRKKTLHKLHKLSFFYKKKFLSNIVLPNPIWKIIFSKIRCCFHQIWIRKPHQCCIKFPRTTRTWSSAKNYLKKWLQKPKTML